MATPLHYSGLENSMDCIVLGVVKSWPRLSHFHFHFKLTHSSTGKESACNAGDPGSILGSGRFAGEGIGYPPQYSWTSLIAQLVKNPLAVQEP